MARRAHRGGPGRRPDLPRHRPRGRLRRHRDLRQRRRRRLSSRRSDRDAGTRASSRASSSPRRPGSTTACWPASTWPAPRASAQLLVLSDGADTSDTDLERRHGCDRRRRGARQRGRPRAGEARGRRGAADLRRGRRRPGDRRRRPSALDQAFTAEADVLARQVLVTADVPADRCTRDRGHRRRHARLRPRATWSPKRSAGSATPRPTVRRSPTSTSR